MMNSSNGFGSSMGNSTGFKKRQLLRPASGMLNKRQQEFLRSVDISQSEPVIATSLRGEVAAIDEEISLLDKDKRIRQGEGTLQKGYVGALRKWLRQTQMQGEREDDDIKILKQMGVDSFEAGFRKLWRIIGNLDLVISKVTELQIVHLLQYEDMFNQIGEDSQRSTSLLSLIANSGYSAATFQITQVLVDRAKDVYCAWSDLKKKGGKGKQEFKSKEESKGREETNQLIKELRQQNSKLNALLEQLSEERERQRTSKEASRKFENTSTISDNSKEVFKEIQEKYKEQLKAQADDKIRTESVIIQLKVKVSNLESQLKSLVELDKPKTGSVAKSGSYEEALVQEMQKMKRGFERRIAVLTDEFTSRERELRKKEADFKNENQKIKWEKSLLLKKFDLLPK